MPPLFQHAVVTAFGQRHVDMPGVVTLGRGQQRRRVAERIVRQCVTCLRQQIGQGIFAAFQCVGAVRRQGQDALIQRQRAVWRAVQTALLLGKRRLRQQGIQPDPARLQRAQPRAHRGDLRLRRFQGGCQRQRTLRCCSIAGRDCSTCLHHCSSAGPREPGTGFSTVAIQRKCGGEQFARTATVGGAELAARQRRIAPLQQLLQTRVRPQPIGQRLAQHHHGQQQTRAQCQHHATERTTAQWRPEAGRSGPARKRRHAAASILGAT
ncbi:hypothetical protein XbrCFBP1976_07760 [Xanthomonas bromi]|uniref:Uncharacterized protein n=1 Tax=Xanthomonas bromi TaxID=56449 RepID=A0ABX5BT49_9XANT|nr:hypothetical protein XbrCFBP1976_07760 [Xanthomonas bromi]